MLPEVATPALLVDVDVLDANIAAMAAHARDHGLALRPHAKTHKCLEVARRQVAAGASGLTVATVAEAEIFAADGVDDLFVAYPLWVDDHKARRLRALADRAAISVGVDSAEAGRALAAQLGEQRDRVRVLVEVDSGHHRSGVLPVDAGPLAEALTRCGLDVRGLFTFPGHSYSPGARAEVAAAEERALTDAVGSLAEHGVAASVVSGGSTPTATATAGGVLNELRPGVYVFGDAQQWELGTFPPAQIALTCLATVVSHAGGNVVLDAGSKVIGADRAPWATGHGRLIDHPDARLVQLSEHHAVVSWPPGTPRPEIGSRLRVVPNHVCNAVNLVDQLVAVQGGRMVACWTVAARGANH